MKPVVKQFGCKTNLNTFVRHSDGLCQAHKQKSISIVSAALLRN